jgi:predicted MFS family arabinose efflux permease
MSTPSTVGGQRSLFAFILSASVASTIGGLPFNTLPIVLGSLAAAYSLSPQQVGDLGGTMFLGYFGGTLLALFLIDRVNWRWMTAGAALGTAAAYAVSASAGVGSLAPALVVVGLFSSVMTSLGMRVLAQLPDTERAFAFRQSTELLTTSVVLFALPPLVVARWGYAGAAWSLAALVILLGLSAFRVPERADDPRAARVLLPSLRTSGLGWLALLVFFVFLTGQIGLWAFLGKFADSAGLTPAENGTAFAVLKVLGGVAALSVAAIGQRIGVRLASILTLGGLALGCVLLAANAGFAGFAAGAWTWEFFLTAGCIYQTATIARFDPSQRLVVLVPAAFAAASMIGPPVAGRLIEAGSTSAALVMSLLAACIPVVFYVALGRRLARSSFQEIPA